MGIATRRERYPCWDTYWCSGDAARKTDTLGRDSIQVRRSHPITAATHGVPPLLIRHEKQNVGFSHGHSPFCNKLRPSHALGSRMEAIHVACSAST